MPLLLFIALLLTPLPARGQSDRPTTPPLQPPPPTPTVAWTSMDPAPEPLGAHRHDGFFLRLGMGLGWAGYGVSERGTRGASAFHSGPGAVSEILLGGTPIDGLVVGGGLLTFGALTDDAPDEDAVFVGMLQLYPDAGAGWHLQATPGVVLIRDAERPFLSGGVGHEWWISHNWSLGVFARYAYFWLDSSRQDDVSLEITDVRQHFHYATASFIATFH